MGVSVLTRNLVFIAFDVALMLGPCAQPSRAQDAARPPTAQDAFEANPRLYSTYSEGPHDGYSWAKRDIWYDKNAQVLSRELILSTRWTLGSDDNWNVKLMFFVDDVFIYGGRGGIAATGRYTVLDSNRVRLYDISLRGWAREHQEQFLRGSPTYAGADAVLTYVKHLGDFWHDDGLRDERTGTLYYADGSAPPVGTELFLDGIRVIKLQEKLVVSAELYFRKRPTPTADSMHVYGYVPMEGADFFLPGHVLRVYAKTAAVDTIDGLSAPWYYVVSAGIEYPYFGWVFGGYLQPYDPLQNKQYRALLREGVKRHFPHLPDEALLREYSE
jgi:hypothetical protein